MPPDNKSNPEPAALSRGSSINPNGLFSINLVISCRIKGDEVFIPYNPDLTNTILINTSGLLIWSLVIETWINDDITHFMGRQVTDCPEESVISADIVPFIPVLSPDFYSGGRYI